MTIVAATLFIVLCALGLLHIYWGLGGRWPGRDEQDLVARTIGRTRNMQMPRFWACSFVATMLLAAAGLVALHSGVVDVALPPTLPVLISIGYWVACAVFLARGVAAYIPGVFHYAQGTPFTNLNRNVYSPICLAIGLAFIVIPL